MALSLVYSFHSGSAVETPDCISEMAFFLYHPLHNDSSVLSRITLDFGEDVSLCHSYAVILYALKKICKNRNIGLTFRLPSRAKNSNTIRFFCDTGIDSILEPAASARLAAELAACKKANPLNHVGVHNLNVPQELTAESIDQFMENFKKKFLEIKTFIAAQEIDSKRELSSPIFELYSNSICHSQSSEGVFAQCSVSSAEQMVTITFYDVGIGIPTSVRSFLQKTDTEFSDIEALDWAMQEANSTKQQEDDYPRGAGFPTLKSFTRQKHGMMFVASGKAYFCSRPGAEKYQQLATSLPGTLIIIKIPLNKVMEDVK